jgi:Amiloride-sensitive sodium channel
LNVTQIYEFMMHDCDAFLATCWWRKVSFKCCEWFSKQRTEYGVCWSFNSFSSVGTPFVNVNSEKKNLTKKKIDYMKICRNLGIFPGEFRGAGQSQL